MASWSSDAIWVWLYPVVQSMNDSASCLVVESIISSVSGSGKSSLGQASLRSWKSTQMQSCPFFFLTGTMFAIHVGYLTSRMNPASMSLLTSFSISGTSSARKHRWGYFLGEALFLMDKRWTATFGSNPGISFVAPSEYIFVLWQEIKVFFFLFLCKQWAYVDRARDLFSSKVHFLHIINCGLPLDLFKMRVGAGWGSGREGQGVEFSWP